MNWGCQLVWKIKFAEDSKIKDTKILGQIQ